MKYVVDPMVQARRFAILGTASGTYTTKQRELTLENAMIANDLITAGRGAEVLTMIHRVSIEGLAAKQSPTLFLLAMLTRCTDDKVRTEALATMPEICRTFAMLSEFLGYHQQGVTASTKTSGWGKGLRKAVHAWFIKLGPEKATYQCLKYRNRNGWTPRDVLRKAHSKPDDPAMNALYTFLTKDTLDGNPESVKVDTFVKAYLAVQEPEITNHLAISLIKEHHLAHEHLGQHLLSSCMVWTALIENGMPITALIRNLGRLTANGTLAPFKTQSDMVAARIRDPKVLERGRVHPFNVLLAKSTYEKGRGDKGKLEWEPVPGIVAALEDAFYLSFKNVKPTGKRIVVGLDVSGSMEQEVMGSSIMASQAAAAMAMVFVRTEPCSVVKAFAGDGCFGRDDRFVDVKINAKSSLSEVEDIARSITMGRTNCAAPMQWAEKTNAKVDVFVIITDSETNTFESPAAALWRYRESSGISDAKLVVVGMTSTGFSIADPDDPGMLDVVGFDSEAPRIVEMFIRGEL